MKQQTGQTKRSRIIEYWDGALLCSPESSTSNADKDVAFLDNAIEHQVLERHLRAWGGPGRRCLDIGAGYGRFTDLFTRFYESVVLLEGSPRIYEALCQQWGSHEQVQCHRTEFEGFEDDKKFDLIFASGVLYLYDEDMLGEFVDKAVAMLNPGGLFVLRDFVAIDKPLVLESNLVTEGSCYYRTPEFWQGLAAERNLKWLEIAASKPLLRLLRSRGVLRVLRRIRLKKLLRNSLVINSICAGGDYRLRGDGYHTVFMGMQTTCQL